MSTRIIGIDLGVTATHKAVVLDPALQVSIGKPWTFRPTLPDLHRLLQRAKRDAPQDVQLVAVLEATGMAWYPVSIFLHDHGVQVYRVNGRKTRDLRKVFSRHAGSDRIDCRVLADLYVFLLKHWPIWLPPSGDLLALQRACREFDRWRQTDVAIQNRLLSYEQWAWGGLSKLIPAIALPWMRRHWYDPWNVSNTGKTALSQAWTAASPKRPAIIDWIPAWVQRAKHMTQLYASQDRVNYPALQLSVQRDLDLLQQSHDVRRDLSQNHILPLYRQLFPDPWLESLPGVGANSAATYIAFIQDISRFSSAAQFRSWCGIIPASHQSGTAESKGSHLTHAGPNLVKATLYLNANVARQYDVQLAALYYRQMVEFGKHHTQAVCACASHLASRIYTLLKQQRPYQLRDLKGNLISPEESRQLCLEEFRVPEDVRKRTRVRARKQRAELRSEHRFQNLNNS